MSLIRTFAGICIALAVGAAYAVVAPLIVLARLVRTNVLSMLGAAMVAASSGMMAVFILHPSFNLEKHTDRGIAAHVFTPPIIAFGFLVFIAGLALQFRKSATAEDRTSGPSWLDRWLGFAGGFGSRTGLCVLAAVGMVAGIAAVAGGLAAYRMDHFMKTPVFCGTACHEVMQPEWTVYQDSPHGNVACVECHIGDTLQGMVAAKVQGTRELVHVFTDRVPRPVPTPVHTLPPSAETCSDCHLGNRDYPDHLVVNRAYLDDRDNTPVFNAVNLKVGSDRKNKGKGIHWHADPAGRIEYKSAEDRREKIVWVRSVKADGTQAEYRLEDTLNDAGDSWGLELRVMDCYDCHNRAAHQFRTPEEEVTLAMNRGLIAADLPFVYAQSLKLLKRSYESSEAMERELPEKLLSYYEHIHPKIHAARKPEIEAAADALKAAYRRNVHHPMRVGWGEHSDHMGHAYRMDGCFRCHNQRMRTADGRNISQDCSLCHDMIADGEQYPAAADARKAAVRAVNGR
ncbi:MAG TPA: NapC/NirT family cytochrome c [Candidatus Brocadiia bacterium]|nr:NapC/NirT family cytochrome c [Candidatus Brocadiia bacterium]